jgi:hypothetical protein
LLIDGNHPQITFCTPPVTRIDPPEIWLLGKGIMPNRFLAIIGCWLALLGIWPANAQIVFPQRNRATGPVVFYAAPNGSDANNSCLDAASPCTPQGAYVQAKVNWDFNDPVGGCFIKLADGTYTVPAATPQNPTPAIVKVTGALVGGYMCQISGHVYQNTDGSYDFGRCPNQNSVIIDAPNGGQGFYIKDGAIVVLSCMKWTGANNAVAVWSQQSLVIDIGDVVCGPIPRCIDAEATTRVNINGPVWL